MSTVIQVIEALAADPDASPEERLAAARAAAARLPGDAGLELDSVEATIAYRAQDGDTLDAIAHRRYGSAALLVHVLAANPDLGRLGPRLPPGTLVGLPDVEAADEPAERPVQLWD